MPPKKDTDSLVGDNIRALCVLMASSADFDPDYNLVAQALGIAQARNVPRKIDSIIKPYGYQVKSKKIVKLNEDGTSSVPATPSTPKSKAPVTPGTSQGDDETPVKSPTKKNGTVKKGKSPAKKTATPKNKKRKIHKVEADQEGDEDDDEATKMIKEKMGDGTDDEDEEHNEGESEDEV